MNTNTLSGVIIFILTLFGCNQQGENREVIRQNEFVIGATNAPITMIVYFDFTCSYCQRLQMEIIDSLKTRFVEQGHLKLVYRLLHDPTDKDGYSILAAEAVNCAGEENAYPILNYLLSFPIGTEQLWNQTDELAALGSLDYDLYRECLALHKTLHYTQGIVHRNNQDQIIKTPTIIINGSKIEGIRPIDYFINIIKAALDSSKAAS